MEQPTPSEDKKSLRAEVVIGGLVQGVWFRASTIEMATRLGLAGCVRNRPDGRVSAVFEGPAAAVRRAVSWCYTGPSMARVESVEVEWGEPTGRHRGFTAGY